VPSRPSLVAAADAVGTVSAAPCQLAFLGDTLEGLALALDTIEELPVLGGSVLTI
jgi:hypothetical protein